MLFRKVTLSTASPESLVDFYSHRLGLPVLEQNENRLVVLAGETQLGFTRAPEGEMPTYHFAFNIPSDAIEQARSWLTTKAIELLYIADYQGDIAEFVNWHARAIYFFDPAGNILEFIARRDRNDPLTGPFSASCIRNVGEVGLVLPPHQYDRRVAALMEKFFLGYFDKQAPLPQFRAIGNDQGLLIVVPHGRTWYPSSHVAAQMAPCQLEFEQHGETYQWNYSGKSEDEPAG